MVTLNILKVELYYIILKHIRFFEIEITFSQSLSSLPTNSDAASIVEASSPNIQKEKNEDILLGHYFASLISEGSSYT